MTTPRITDDFSEPDSPTAKAYLTVDLTPFGNGRDVGASHAPAYTLTHKIIDFGSTLQGGAAPALTIYVGKGYLSAKECLIVIGIQFVTTMMLARRTGRAIGLRIRKSN